MRSAIFLFSVFIFRISANANYHFINFFSINQLAISIDTTLFKYSNARFDVTDKTGNYVDINGFSIRYAPQWEREYRSEDDLMLYLRPYDKNAPHIFREIITVTSEGLIEGVQDLQSYADMMLSISADVWSRYKVDFIIIEKEKFTLNGIEAYRVKADISRMDQSQLFVFLIYGPKAYTIEYTATHVSFDDSLELVWKMINSASFIQK